MASSPVGPSSNDLSQLLRWVGVAFIGVFGFSTLLGLFPVALLQPAWQLRTADVLVNAVTLPMMGALLIIAADRVNERPGPQKLISVIRGIALVAAFGYLLLIPLQIVANVNVTRASIVQADSLIRKAKEDVAVLAKADSPAAMDAVLARMPQNVQQAALGLPADSFESRRDQLVDLLTPQLDKATATGLRVSRERWFRAIFGSSRFTVVALFWAIGCAALGSRSPNGPSLLHSIFHLRQALAKQPKSRSRPARPKPKESPEQIERWKQAKRDAAQRQAAKRQSLGRSPQRPRNDASNPLGGLLGDQGKGRQGGRARRPGAVAPEWFEDQSDGPGSHE